MSDILAKRAARLMREDAHKSLRAALWEAHRLCQDEGGCESIKSVTHAAEAIDLLSIAMEQYSDACAFADRLFRPSGGDAPA